MLLDDLPLVLTVTECAQVLRVSRPHAFRLVKEGRLRALRLGRRLVVPRASLERLLAEVAEGSEEPAADDRQIPINLVSGGRR